MMRIAYECNADRDLFLFLRPNQNNDVVSTFGGLACAAAGTSTWRVCTGDDCESGGVWTIPQAYYTWWHWVAGYSPFGGFDREWVTGGVNDQYHPALHTYCGYFNY